MDHSSERQNESSRLPSKSEPNTTRSSPQERLETSMRTADFYLHMSRIFGHTWIAQNGATDDGMWEAIIGPMSPGAVAAGIQHCLTEWTESWPPTPGQFLSFAVVPTAHQPLQRREWVEPTAEGRAIRDENIRQMREILK